MLSFPLLLSLPQCVAVAHSQSLNSFRWWAKLKAIKSPQCRNKPQTFYLWQEEANEETDNNAEENGARRETVIQLTTDTR